jgi:hypothetical protein
MDMKHGLLHCRKSILTVLKNRALMKIFGLRGKKVKGGWRKLYNEQLHDLYSKQNITRMIISKRMRQMCTMGRIRDACWVFARKHEGKQQLGTPSHR